MIALLVAPMLAIIAWFAVDYFVAERPQAASPGESYPLVARPNCRRLSDACELANADLTLTLVVTRASATGATVELTSVLPLGRRSRKRRCGRGSAVVARNRRCGGPELARRP